MIKKAFKIWTEDLPGGTVDGNPPDDNAGKARKTPRAEQQPRPCNTTAEPGLWAHEPRWLKPVWLKPVLHKRTHQNEKLAQRN